MPLKIKCPTCQRVLSVPVQRIGGIVRCPVCEKKLRVPKPKQSKTEDAHASGKPAGARRRKPRSADRNRESSSPLKDPPRVKREPSRSPEAERSPERPTKPPPTNSTFPELPPARPEPPPPASKAVPPKRDSSEKEPQTPETPDPPKPPPLSKAKRKRPEATPDASHAESPAVEPRPKEKQSNPDADEPAAKTEPKKRRRLDEQDRRPSPDRPPLPRKTAEQERPREDSRSKPPPKPPQVPSRPHREERRAAGADTASEEPEREVVRGYEHDIHRRRTVYYLGIALILTAFFGAIPAAIDIVRNLRAIEPPGISRWAYALLLASAIQLAYAVYLMQLPDWSTAWVVSLVTLVMATGYAMFLGIAILAKPDNQIIDILKLAENGYGKKAAGWCLIMLSISSLLAYFSGRISVRWRRAYDLVTRAAKE